MRELAIGDIHGCGLAFRTLLERVQPEPSDTVVLLGDYVDRGPESCQVIDLILDLRKRCNVIALTGNHEVMMIQARSDAETLRQWRMFGGDETLESYHRAGYAADIDEIPERHWLFLTEQALNYWETDRSIFVHGAIHPDVEIPEQSGHFLFWEQFTDPMRHKSGKEIICGHTSQKAGWPAVFDHGICIDTWAYGGGWLTCLDTFAKTFIQTNEAGESRTFGLSALREERDES